VRAHRLLLALVLLPLAAWAADTVAVTPAGQALVADINTEIHAVSADFVKRTIREAEDTGVPLVVFRINTPGGRLDSTREMTQAILSSKVPVVGYVTPPGAQAASAGFLVLMACDVAAMAPGTNAGAASPVGGQGEDLQKTIKKKVSEDVAALLRSVTAPRGRPTDAAVKTVTDGLSYSETESADKKLIEIVARDLDDLFRQLDGRTIRRVGKPDATLKTAGLGHRVKVMTPLQRALGVVASPALAGLLFLIGLVGIYAEMQTPGAILPGILGGICLLLALFAMSVLPTNGAGMALILLGVLFFFLEVKLTGHGLFALGGGTAMILGAVLLFARNELAPKGEFWFVVAGAATSALILAALSIKALSIQGLPERTGAGALVGQVVPAMTALGTHCKIFVDGALWDARSSEAVSEGDPLEIVGMEGLLVLVRPKKTT
jgi:membrane-bound serine protease (ClpP class)